MAKLIEEYAGNQSDENTVHNLDENGTRSTGRHYLNNIFALAAFVVSVNVFYWLMFYVKFNAPISAERSVLLYLHRYESSLLDHLAMAFSTLVTTVSVTVLIYLLYRRRWQPAFFWFIATAGSALLSGIAKKVVHRIRPEFWDVISPQASFGFPSGHATESMAIFIAALFLIRTPKTRAGLMAMAAILIPLVGLCRMYLGLHYPTDIFAGWALSLAWVSALALAFNLFNQDDIARSQLLLHKNLLIKDGY